MKRFALGLATVALVLVATPPLAAQENLPLRVEVLETGDYPDVEMTVSLPVELAAEVVDREDFVVTEDGKEVIATVEKVPTEGLDVVLLIDTSGSMTGGAIAAAEEAAAAFVERMTLEVEIAIVGFGEEATVLSEFTADKSATLAALSSLGARGETALYDGLIAATELFPEERDSRRVVVMLSDGGDTVSSATLEEAIVALLNAEATYFAVELRTAENDHESLERLGTATNGRVVPAGDPEALADIFDEIAASIVSQYRIGFTASGHDQTELTVSVTAAGLTAGLVRIVRFPSAPPPPKAPPDSAPAPPVTTASAPAATAPPIVVSPPRATVISVGWLGSRDVLLAGFAALFTGLVGLTWYAGRGTRRVKLAADDLVAATKTSSKKSGLTSASEWVAGVAERGIGKGQKGKLETSLEAAGLSLRPGEFVMLVLSAAFAAFVFGNLLLTPATGLVLAALGVVISMLVLSHKASKRQKEFAEQLVTTLQLITGSLRAGFGLMQAFEVVIEESPSPTNEEFHRVKVESHLGRDLDEALEAMARRVQSEDFGLVIEGIQIHREIGGNLTDIIEGVTETIRERHRLHRQVRALSAEGRFSAVILVGLPLLMAVVLSITNPDYLGELTGTTGGRITLVATAGLMLVGILWMKRLVKIDY